MIRLASMAHGVGANGAVTGGNTPKGLSPYTTPLSSRGRGADGCNPGQVDAALLHGAAAAGAPPPLRGGASVVRPPKLPLDIILTGGLSTADGVDDDDGTETARMFPPVTVWGWDGVSRSSVLGLLVLFSFTSSTAALPVLLLLPLLLPPPPPPPPPPSPPPLATEADDAALAFLLSPLLRLLDEYRESGTGRTDIVSADMVPSSLSTYRTLTSAAKGNPHRSWH